MAHMSTEVPVQKKPKRTAPAIVFIVVVVVVSVALAAFTMPLSKVRLLLMNEVTSGFGGTIHVGIYIDGELMEAIYLEISDTYYSEYEITRGIHTVGFDISNPYYQSLDGKVDLQHEFEVGLGGSAHFEYNLHDFQLLDL